eukprot:s1982_g1.t5
MIKVFFPDSGIFHLNGAIFCHRFNSQTEGFVLCEIVWSWLNPGSTKNRDPRSTVAGTPSSIAISGSSISSRASIRQGQSSCLPPGHWLREHERRRGWMAGFILPHIVH